MGTDSESSVPGQIRCGPGLMGNSECVGDGLAPRIHGTIIHSYTIRGKILCAVQLRVLPVKKLIP